MYMRKLLSGIEDQVQTFSASFTQIAASIDAIN